MRKIALVPMLLALAVAGPPAASAHNAGHVILPNGDCRNVGSGREAPLVPEQNPNRNSQGQLDLIAGPGDQYGARFAAEQGNSAVRPGSCPT